LRSKFEVERLALGVRRANVERRTTTVAQAINMLLSPLRFLAVLVALTAIARLVYVLQRQRQRRALQDLARRWNMHYSPHDRFQLADKVAERFPLPGAAELRVVDLVYGTEGDFYRYLFSAEYTVGVTRRKHRQRRVVTFREPKGRTTAADWSELILAEPGKAVMEQYESLREAQGHSEGSGSDPRNLHEQKALDTRDSAVAKAPLE